MNRRMRAFGGRKLLEMWELGSSADLRVQQ